MTDLLVSLLILVPAPSTDEAPRGSAPLIDGSIVLIAADSHLPHPAYLKAMRKGALILVPKPIAPAKVSP
jgi:hypothetical protein